MTALQDKTMKCISCGREFVFTVREQEFYESKGFSEPRHCYDCRAKRKREKDANTDSATYKKPKLEVPPISKREFQISCAACGKTASVPFKPVTGRPVYCKECFAKVKSKAEKTRSKESPSSHNPENQNISNHNPSQQENASQQNYPEFDADLGPLPEVEPAPDEENEITQVEFIPIPINVASTPEEVNPIFKEPNEESKE